MPTNLTDIAAERSVLGSMLRCNAVIGDVLQLVRRECFTADANQKVFAAVVELYDAGKPADLVTVAEVLLRRKHLDDVGAGYLGELWDASPTSANAEYYAAIVHDKAVLRELAHAGREICRLAEQPADGAATALAEAESLVFRIAEGAVAGSTQSLSEALREAGDRIDARAANGSGAGAVPTGFLDIDDKTAGLQDGELCILAARPSVGKTSLALGIARNAAIEHGLPVLFVSLEMKRVELAERLLCSEASVDSGRVRTGKLNADEATRLLGAQAKLSKARFFIDDSSSQTMTRIAANARRLKLRYGIRLVVVDYLQLIDPEDRKANRQEQVAAISRRLKQLAGELCVPVLALAQLNRNVEYRTNDKPRLADLRDSGGIEQDADTVILLHKPEDSTGTVEAIIAKQRNGPTGEVTLTFLKQFMRYENFAFGDNPYQANRVSTYTNGVYGEN